MVIASGRNNTQTARTKVPLTVGEYIFKEFKNSCHTYFVILI